MNDLSRRAAKPAHVPDAAVYDFDMFLDPGLCADPHDRIRAMHVEAPEVFWTPRNGGHWMLLSHAANFEAARDPARFSNSTTSPEAAMAFLAQLPAGSPRVPAPFPIGLDPPMHDRYRAPLQKVFSPKTVMALKGDIVALADQLIDAFVDDGRCDFIPAVAEPLPVTVFLRMLGLPVEKMWEFRGIIHEFMAPPIDALDQAKRMWKVMDAMRDTMLARRDAPQDDIISLLWKTEIDGRPMTWEDMENYGLVLFTAGLDTVINGMGFGIRHLATDLPLQARLRAEPKLVMDAAEEILRRYTFTVPPRAVARDQEYFGWPMKKGEAVMLFLPGADLDPKTFPEADRFDLDRENNVHIAFGAGPHRCLGSHLARIELQVIYERMLARLPEFRLDPDQPPRFHGGYVIGVDTLPIVWNI